MVQALVQRLVLERGLELAVQPQLISVPLVLLVLLVLLPPS
jgi:hypothetical protein